jgi:hypothetical protein
MNPMTNYRPGRAIARAIIFVVCLAAFLSLFGCASAPTGEPERIQLRSGQWCEIHGSKIVGCERNNRRFAETAQDIEAIVGAQDEN